MIVGKGGHRRPAPWGVDKSVDPAGITTYALPAALNGTYSWIGSGSLWTTADTQYAVWVDDNRKARIAQRLWRRPWSTAVDLSAASGTVFGAQFALDSHNTIAVAADARGYVHVAGDHHAVPLKYMRSSQPATITGSWTGNMVGSNETSVTYPQFVRARNGTLFFFYRDGSSGDGDWILNKWNTLTLSWSRVATVLQGSVDNNSAYPHHITVDELTGRWHLLWTFRIGGTEAANNTDICYAHSDDDGVTWRDTAGAAYALPISRATAEIVVDLPGGTPETVLNGGATDVDANGRPQSVWLVADGSGVYRYRHVWLDESNAWHYDTLLPSTNSSGRVPGLVLWPDGRRWMLFQNGAGGRGNTLRYLDIDAQTETVLRDANMLHHTPAFEYSTERGVLYLLAPYERQNGALGGDPADLGAQLNVPVLAVR